MWDRLKQIGLKEFLTIPLQVWSIVLAIWIIGLAISMPAIWIGLKKNADQIPLMVGSFGALFLGTVGLLGLYVNYRRTRAFEKQLGQQGKSDKRRDNQQLYATNVQHLGNNSESVRLGGIYGLGRLAKESKIKDLKNEEPEDKYESWVPTVTEILCARIRVITTETGYFSENEESPSNETAAILKVLTQLENNPFNPVEFDLSGAILSGARLRSANLHQANLNEVNLTRAVLSRANLSRADLNQANLDTAILLEANLSGAKLRMANMERARLRGADLRRAGLIRAKMNGADLSGTDLRGARLGINRPFLKLDNISRLNLSGADLSGANLIKTDLSEANLRGVRRLTYDRGGLKKENWGNFTECIFDPNEDKLTDLRDIYWGVFTQGFKSEIEKDRNANTDHIKIRYPHSLITNADRYLIDNAVRREPTEKEKEQLVGKENVKKCRWGEIYVLGEEGIQEGLELE